LLKVFKGVYLRSVPAGREKNLEASRTRGRRQERKGGEHKSTGKKVRADEKIPRG